MVLEHLEIPADVLDGHLKQASGVAAPTEPSASENVQTLLMRQKLGVSKRQLLKELGYDDALIEQMLAEGPNLSAGQIDAAMNGGGDPLSLPVADGRVAVS